MAVRSVAEAKRQAIEVKAVFAEWPVKYDYWAGEAVWSIDEASALLLDIEPSFSISFGRSGQSLRETMEANNNLPISQKYRNFQALLLSDMPPSKYGMDKQTPYFFIEWAKSRDIKVPSKLLKALKKHGQNHTDWPAKSIEQAEEIERLEGENAALKKEIAELKKAPASLNENSSNSATDSDLIADKNKSTLLWLLGVALHKAWPKGFAANDRGNTLAGNILSHVSSNNLLPKVKKAAVATAILESRDAVVIAVSEIADNATTAAKEKPKG